MRLEKLLRELSAEREDIAEAMAFALEHAEAAEEVVRVIAESLTLPETAIQLKVARLYLVSDILHNSSAPVPKASQYRKYFESTLPAIFASLNEKYRSISGRITALGMKEQITRVLRTWEVWSVYPQPFIHKLEQAFFSSGKEAPAAAPPAQAAGAADDDDDDDVDGVPLGAPLQPSAVSGAVSGAVDDDDDDLDGVPLDASALAGQKRDREGYDPTAPPSKWNRPD